MMDNCPKGLLCRGAPKIDVCACVRAVRPTDRPSVRPHQNGPDLVTRNWVLALVTPSSVTNSGSVRDAFDLVTRNWVLALVTRSSVTKSERFWSESWTGPDLWSLSTQKALRATLPCWCYLVYEWSLTMFLSVLESQYSLEFHSVGSIKQSLTQLK